MYGTAMIEGSALEPDCPASDAYCNGSAPAGNSLLPDNQRVSADKLSDVLSSTWDAVHAGDVCTQLDEDSGDLHLAAQLGKVLLQENQELRLANQQMIQEFNEKIEVASFSVWLFCCPL